MTGLSDYQRGVLDAFAPAEALEDTVMAFVVAEPERRDGIMGSAHHARLARWRDRNTRLVERTLDAFEDLNRQVQRPPLSGGRTYPLPDQPDEADRAEHAAQQRISEEGWAA